MLRALHLLFEFCCTKSTPSPLGPVAKGVLRDQTARKRGCGSSVGWHCLIGILLGTFCQTGMAQMIDSFDEGRPRFALWKNDARAVLTRPPRSEPGVESLEIQMGQGSFVYLAYSIEPCGIIPELNGSMRIRSAERGYRMGFRVVFPHARHPATHEPLTEILLGTAHEGAGRWSTSTISDVVPKLEERQRFLRHRDGPDIDLRDPYIDAVILSVFGYPGISRIQIDDLMVDGMIAPNTLVEDGLPSGALREEIPMSERLRVLQSKVPRWIQHQGESLAYLQSLGFNAVIAQQSQERLVLDQAAETQMGVIMPPPSAVPLESQADQYRNVSAWLLGLSLNQSQIEAARGRVAGLSRFPQSLARPTVGEAWELYGSYSRLSDWISVPMPLATTVRSSRETAEILRSDLRPIAGRQTPITSLWTQMPNEWIAQRQLACSLMGHDPWLLPDHDRLQSRLQLIRSIMHGARGWIFRSPTPLDAGDETSTVRAASFAGLNQEIEVLLPWIQASESKWRTIPVDSPNHAASILETPNSQLILVVAAGTWDQVCSPAPAPDRLVVTLPVSGQPREVYRITHAQLERCATQTTAGGMTVTIERPGLVEQIVSVVDTAPVTYLRDTLSRRAAELAENRIDIATQTLQIAQMTVVARQVSESDPAWEQIRQAQAAARAASNHLVRSEFPRACQAADAATLRAQGVIRAAWDEALTQFQTVSSSPLIASPLSLPLHWELDRALQGRTWGSAAIPGIPFASLEQWNASGWRSDHRLEESIESSVAITREVGPSGSPTMLITARSLNGQPVPSGYAGASMRVTSPKITVPMGAFVHIEGLVQVESLKDQSQSGLLVCDNFGGEALGQLVSSYDATDSVWRRISLFRLATHENGLEIYFETRGQVQAAVTDLNVQMIMPAQNQNLPIGTAASIAIPPP
jgi:hypothetical protein